MAFAGQVSAQTFTVSETDALCLLENKQAYLGDGAEPVIIFAPACPETDLTVGMRTATQNAPMPRIKTADGDEVDTILVYTRAELECLSAELVVFDAGRAILPAKPSC